MVKKKIKPAPNIIKDMERQKFLKFRDEYRLKHPFFNFVYNSFPLSLGVASGFISGFLWTPIFQMGPMIGFMMLITGCCFGFALKVSHKEFDKEKNIFGFKDQFNGKHHSDPEILRTDYSKYRD